MFLPHNVVKQIMQDIYIYIYSIKYMYIIYNINNLNIDIWLYPIDFQHNTYGSGIHWRAASRHHQLRGLQNHCSSVSKITFHLISENPSTKPKNILLHPVHIESKLKTYQCLGLDYGTDYASKSARSAHTTHFAKTLAIFHLRSHKSMETTLNMRNPKPFKIQTLN